MEKERDEWMMTRAVAKPSDVKPPFSFFLTQRSSSSLENTQFR